MFLALKDVRIFRDDNDQFRHLIQIFIFYTITRGLMCRWDDHWVFPVIGAMMANITSYILHTRIHTFVVLAFCTQSLLKYGCLKSTKSSNKVCHYQW